MLAESPLPCVFLKMLACHLHPQQHLLHPSLQEKKEEAGPGLDPSLIPT